MPAIPVDPEASTDSDAPRRNSFWYRFAAVIDSLAEYPVRHALSEHELSHVDVEIERCRRLMHARPQRFRGAVVSLRIPAQNIFAAIKVRS
jgi:hypothetical protein